MLAAADFLAGLEYELVVYEGEGHGFLQPGNLQHFYATLERFLDWHLL
jgi:dipeptidyl aminopeptidase/acylaminoacyl peptidase